MTKWNRLIKDTSGDAIVEATILFPIMIMIFAALVMLAMYLPQRTILQEAAQFTAVALATESSDIYVAFDNEGNGIVKENHENVYAAALSGILGKGLNVSDKALNIASYIAGRGFVEARGDMRIELITTNYVVYQEITVRLYQTIPMPVDLSFIGFPAELELVQEASAVVQNGDEFIRNIDIASDMLDWVNSRFGISNSLKESGALEKIGEVTKFFGFGV